MAGEHRAPHRSGRRWTTVAVAAAGAAGALGVAPSASGDPIALGLTTTVVTPDNAAAHGFGEPDTRPPGDVTFTEDYGDPNSTTDGALGLSTPDGNSKATYFTTEQNGSLDRFATSASYATYKSSSSTGNAIQYPSYQITIDANGSAAGGFSTLFYEPVYNVAASDLKLDTWQTWDVASGLFCSTRQIGGFESNQTRCDNGGLRTLDDIVAANPDATVSGFGLNQGSGNPGIVAAADSLTGAGHTYDFELKEPPVVIPPIDPGPGPDPQGPQKPDDPGKDDGEGKDRDRGDHHGKGKHHKHPKDHDGERHHGKGKHHHEDEGPSWDGGKGDEDCPRD